MESFVCDIAEKVLERLASHAYQEICLAWGAKVELHKIKDLLSTITKVIRHAEKKQTDNPPLTDWLGKLKAVCYDIDDVVDEFEYHQLRMRLLNRPTIKGKVRNLFLRPNSVFFNLKLGHAIKNIRARLVEIAAQKDQFSLSELSAGDRNEVHMERETYSDVYVPDVIGRDDDKEEIISHLFKDTGHDDDDSVSVISIKGLGGLGKTTLAQLVYKDNRIIENFDLRMWVCVSDDFNNKRLIHQMIRLAGNQGCQADESIEEMRIKLGKALKDKKFLLVLDDVWDKEPNGVTLQNWNSFNSLLKVGSNGSKIIVTTRNESVASLMRSAHMHELHGLPHQDCMSIFIKIAFRKREEHNYPNLIAIGEDIVKKCGGVPLAVSTLGGLLYSKREKHYWSQVRDNDIWKLEQGNQDILPALKLSYDALPLYLKPCFAFCSLFAKDYEFNSKSLISLWMAHGFLKPSEGNQEFEEIGMDYIRQLCSRSLFQIVDDYVYRMNFKMHDLVHDLAMSVSQGECSSLNYRPSPSNAWRKVRHMSISKKELSRKLEEEDQFLLHLDKLRTILFTDIDCNYNFFLEDIDEDEISGQSLLQTCISRFKYLRVLHLELWTIAVLPSSIGKLSHLRYLDLSRNKHIEKLPNSICKLYNLQTLLLDGCKKLKELPKDIGNLINLRCLSVTINHTCFPKSFARLTSLRILGVRNCENMKSLGEGMQSLRNLGRLDLWKCEKLECLPWMKNFTALHTLVIRNCRNLNLMGSGEGIPSLRSFSIGGSNLEALPDWLRESGNSLQYLYVGDCDYLTALPEWLQDLRLLQRVDFNWCLELLALPEGMQRLTALRYLEIKECPKLSERCKRKQGQDWPKIAHVTKIMLDGEDIASTNHD